jgi:hypothetical protein
MKRQVLLRCFGGPFVLAILLVIGLCYNAMTPFQVFMNTVFVVSITILSLLSDNRFLVRFHVKDDRIYITYLTRFLQEKSMDIALSEISEVRLSKRSVLSALWPPHLNLKFEDERFRFTVLTKDRYNEVQQHQTHKKTLTT